MKTRDIHVFPHNKGWAVKKENTQRASYVSANEEEAIDRARRQAKRQRVEVVIHDEDGKIRDSDSS
jgi:hypothetical protein